MGRPDRIAAILLAAGRSERFGADDKLMAMLDGRPLVAHAAGTLSGMEFGALIAVCAAQGQAQHVAEAQGFAIAHPPQHRAEMAHSIAAGVKAAAALPEIDAVLLCLDDMPYVSRDHLRAVISAHDGADAPAIASSDGAAAMPPALFGRGYFAQLQNLRGDSGAKALLQNARLIYADHATLADIDRIEDLGG